jgi:hypothetical protein
LAKLYIPHQFLLKLSTKKSLQYIYVKHSRTPCKEVFMLLARTGLLGTTRVRVVIRAKLLQGLALYSALSAAALIGRRSLRGDLNLRLVIHVSCCKTAYSIRRKGTPKCLWEPSQGENLTNMTAAGGRGLTGVRRFAGGLGKSPMRIPCPRSMDCAAVYFSSAFCQLQKTFRCCRPAIY